MIEIKINLTSSDIEASFFKDGYEKLFFSPITKQYTIWCFITGCITILTQTVFIFTNRFKELTELFLFMFILYIILLIKQLFTLLKWKKSVREYAAQNAKHSTYKLILGNDAFSFFTDEIEVIEKWSTVKKVELKEDTVEIYASKDFIFFKSTMLESDFTILKDFILENVLTINQNNPQ
ncbi:MAG: hypothetical protein ACEQSR_07395 [Candidatus Methylacidiphilales bacterium]